MCCGRSLVSWIDNNTCFSRASFKTEAVLDFPGVLMSQKGPSSWIDGGQETGTDTHLSRNQCELIPLPGCLEMLVSWIF